MKPFRMLTSMEEKQLDQHIRETFNQWLQQYALMEADVYQSKDINYPLTQALVNKSQQALIVLSKNWLQFWTELLFDCDADVFYPTTKNIVLSYFNDLAGESLLMDEAYYSGDLWQYFGTPAQSFCFKSKNSETMMVLSPDVVLKRLGTSKTSAKPLTPITECIDEKSLSFDVECSLGHITLQDIRQLQAGDVLVSDIPVGSPIYLTHDGQKQAEVVLGQQSGKKSIKIRSFL